MNDFNLFQVRRTAFFDDSDEHSAVTVNIMKYDKFRVHPRLQLKVVYNSFSELCVPLRVWKKSGVYGKHPNLFYVSYVMKTTEPIYGFRPTHVMFTEDVQCKDHLSVKIPIYRAKQKKKVKFGVCLHQALYNRPNVQEIIDWIVLHQLMGVEIIYIYLETRYMPRTVPETIQSFVEAGLVELVDWSINKETYDYGQFGVIQDCLYRAKSAVDYLALYDLDEVIVPRNQMTWSDMLTEIEQHAGGAIKKYASLSFENRIWIDNSMPLKVSSNKTCSKMSLPIYLQRTQRSLVKHPPKLIIRPEFVDSCWIHYVLQKKHDMLLQYNVPPSIAFVNHYRKVYHDSITDSVFDDSMLRFADASVDLIQKHLCKYS